MKNITLKLIELFKKGYCSPQLSRIAKKLQEPSTTLHYNIKKLEKEGSIKTYKAVFDYKKIGEGFCAIALINLVSGDYHDPEEIAAQLADRPEIESIDMVTGDWELVVKIRTKDQDAYYNFVKNVLSKKGMGRITSLISLKQVKTEFVKL
jgi:DNA-binding Lrp family transcriptional regulator